MVVSSGLDLRWGDDARRVFRANFAGGAFVFQLYGGRRRSPLLQLKQSSPRADMMRKRRLPRPEEDRAAWTRGETTVAYMNLNGARLHWRESGEGAPVIALHGSASTGAQWRSLTGCLEGRWRVITPDLPGYGLSEAAPGRGLGLAADAAQIAALAARLGQPVHLVGHSYGGAVALKLARVAPRLVRSLTLIEPAAFHLLRDTGPADRALMGEVEAVAQRIAAHADIGRADAAIRSFVDFWNGEGAWTRTSPRLQAALVGGLDAVLANFAAIAWERDRLADIPGIGLPVLAVMGLDSRPVTMRLTEILAETLPRAELRMIPGAGHMAPLTDPHLVDPMIAAHLARVEAREPAGVAVPARAA
jgi:pimeloyl-ACP methyl ester carboxylesterase